jgi:O-antigen/teichoic acid export membrane protein
MLKFGGKALFGSVSPIETLQLDQLFVGLVLSPAALGLYVVANAFTNLPRFVALGMGMVVYPRVAAIRDMELARRRVWKFAWITMAACSAVILVLELSVGALVDVFFGAEFTPAVTVARILLLGSVFLCARRVLSDATRGAGFPALGTIAEVAAWVWLVPALIVFVVVSVGEGPEGAALAVASSYVFSFVVTIVLMNRVGLVRQGDLSSPAAAHALAGGDT